jgi:cyclic pyranopterin phosphate synthase
MPPEGIQRLRHEDILSFDEILEVITKAVGLGVDKVRLTGGEPLVRKGIVELIRMIAGIPGVKDLSMTTNGILLSQFASDLKAAGLHRVNVSLDTTHAESYRQITRGGDIKQVLQGIQAAKQAGLLPIKLNCVIEQSSSEVNAALVKEYAEKNNLQVRFIKQMDLTTGQFSVVEGGAGGHCEICNRLRLTSNGIVKPCLFNTTGFSVRKHGAKQALLLAVANKPRCGTVNHSDVFYEIGG